MSVLLELWRSSGVESVALAGERVTVGADRSNGVWIADDVAVSRLHAALENYGSGWAVRDLGSRNGIYLNGELVLGERALHDGDELRIGGTRLVKTGAGPTRSRSTVRPRSPSFRVAHRLCRDLSEVP